MSFMRYSHVRLPCIDVIVYDSFVLCRQCLSNADIKISMDGRRRWIDNVFIERLWRSLKYKCVY